MRTAFFTLALAGMLALGLAACASSDAACCGSCSAAASASVAGGTADDVPFTSTRAVYVEGDLRGYLQTYEEIPDVVRLERDVPAGTAFIQDVHLERNLGFITPEGRVFRFTADGGVEEVFQGELRDNLAHFFGADAGAIALRDPAP